MRKLIGRRFGCIIYATDVSETILQRGGPLSLYLQLCTYHFPSPPPPQTRLSYSPSSPRICLYVYCIYTHERTEQAGPLISWWIQFRTLDTYITYIHELGPGCTQITIIHHTRAVLNRTSTDARSTVVSRLTLCRCCSSNIIMRSQTNVARELVEVAEEDSWCRWRPRYAYLGDVLRLCGLSMRDVYKASASRCVCACVSVWYVQCAYQTPFPDLWSRLSLLVASHRLPKY